MAVRGRGENADVGGDASGVNSALGSIVDGFQNAIASLGEAFKENINPDRLYKTIMEVDEAAYSISKSFGTGAQQVQNLKTNLSDAIVKINNLGGSFEDISKIQSDAAQTLGRNVVIAGEEYEKLFATQQVTSQSTTEIVGSFKDVGISLYQSTKEMEKVIGRAREIGVNATAVSSQVLANMDMLNKYTFKNGVDGLAKMAAQAVNLRINVNEISGAMDKAFNPESAIEMAASLQRLGVAQSDLLDPLRLMDLAQNDPAELQNQIAEMSKQFVKLSDDGKFEIMPGSKRQLQEIASAMGMSYSTLTKMAIGSKELDDKMSKIRFPDTFTEEQKKMIANMAEMGEGGEYKMTLDGDTLNMEDAIQKIQSMSEEDQKKLFDAQKPVKMEDLASESLSTQQSMLAVLEGIRNKLPAALAGSKAVGKFTGTVKSSAQDFGKSLDDELTSVTTIRKKLNETTTGLSEAFEGGTLNVGKFREVMNSAGEYVGTTFMGELEKIKTLTKGGLFGDKSDNEGPNYLTKAQEEEEKKKKDAEAAAAAAAKKKQEEDAKKTVAGSDVIKMPGQNVQLLPQDSIFAMTKGPEFLEKMKSLGDKNNASYSENKNTHDITLTVKIDGGNLSQDKIMEVLNRTETLQALNKKLKETVNSNGLMV